MKRILQRDPEQGRVTKFHTSTQNNIRVIKHEDPSSPGSIRLNLRSKSFHRMHYTISLEYHLLPHYCIRNNGPASGCYLPEILILASPTHRSLKSMSYIWLIIIQYKGANILFYILFLLLISEEVGNNEELNCQKTVSCRQLCKYRKCK